MEALLHGLQEEILHVTAPWFSGEGDPISLLMESLENMVQVCYQRGPILRAVSDAAPMDKRLEKAWARFVKDFDDAVTLRIEQQQAAGLIKPFDARPVAMALNRMDAYLIIDHFGRRPRGSRESVLDAILRVWISTLYGEKALANCLSRSKAPATAKKQ
jgi:Fe-S-cluster formation regulator IscX/YfhJ